MKRILFTLLFLLAFFAGYSQMNNNGGVITVESGATLVIEGNYTSTSSGAIEIDGNVQLKGNFINNSGTVATGSTGRLTLNGTSAQEITGSQSTTFFCALEVNNVAGVALTTTSTGASQVCDSTLILTNGKVTLNGFNLTLSNEGVSGATSAKYVVTNTTGQLKAPVTSVDYLFPVGTSTSYNPLTLNEAGTADTYGVLYASTMPAGWTGTDHAVTGHWTVTEVTPGGNTLTAKPQWNGSQEQPSFTRTDCAVGVSTDNGASVNWKASGAASGTNPYTQTGTGFSSVGKFLVGDSFFLFINLDVDLFLAGPYNGATMNTGLTVPLTDPYGLGTTVTSIPANTVDWIKIQLRDKTNRATVLYEGAFFLDNTGNVLNTDGATGAKITSVPKDQYYVAVVHRNHFGVVSNSTVDLTASTPSYNFSTSQAQAWQNPAITTNAAMKQVSTGVFGLWEGDANNDGIVNYFGGGTDRANIVTQLGPTTLGIPVSGYFNNDLNMDGTVNYFGSGTDRSVMVAVLGPTTLGIPITRHLP
jgi:hypothetical protein